MANNAEIIQFIGTNNAARDIDSIRRALGEDEISYYSYWDEGYGSELGGVWATMFPTTVRAAVLDAAPDPNNDGNQALVQAEGYENELSTYLAECSADPGCAFHNDGDAEGAFDDLMLQLDATPIPSREGRPDHHPWRRPHRRHLGVGRCQQLALSCPPPSIPPSKAAVPACCGGTTSTSATTVTARGPIIGR